MFYSIQTKEKKKISIVCIEASYLRGSEFIDRSHQYRTIRRVKA